MSLAVVDRSLFFCRTLRINTYISFNYHLILFTTTIIPFFFVILDEVFYAFDFDFNEFNQKTCKIRAMRIFTKGYC